MRTTVTLDHDVCRLLIEAAHRSGRYLKQVLNDAVRTGLQGPEASYAPLKQPVFSLGRSSVDLTKAGALSSDLAARDAIDACGRSRK